MKDWKEIYRQKLKTPEEALDLLEDRDYVYVAQAAGEPAAIMEKLTYLKTTGKKGMIMNTTLPLKYYEAFKDPEMKGILDQNSFFYSAGLRDAHKKGLANPIPQSSTSVIRKSLDRVRYENRRPVILATVAPPDKHGYMSLSISAIYERDLINEGALAIVECNPNYPRTFGETQVHVSEVAAIVESDRPIPIVEPAPYTEVDAKIGKLVASLVEDGSTIQLGIGNIPNAVAQELRSKKHLGIHTEMFTESMIDLIECGAVDNSQKGLLDGYSVCSFTMGSQRLYDYIDDNPSVLFKSCTFTNSPWVIAQNNKFVSINAALEIDLTGQCAAETVGPMHWSGTGGHFETVQGSQMSKGGKSIIAMHSTYSKTDEKGEKQTYSKIVTMLKPGSAVSTSRNDTDYVVTEYGIAWLRGRNDRERIDALIAIAHPDFRDELRREAERVYYGGE